MNLLKKGSLASFITVSSLFLGEGCPPNPSPNPDQVSGQIDLNNEEYIARVNVNNKKYDFYSNDSENLGVKIEIPNLTYYLELYSDPSGQPAYVQHPHGTIAKIDYFKGNKAGITFITERGISFSKEIPKSYVDKNYFTSKNIEKLNREEICSNIEYLTNNGRLLSKYAGLLSLAGCVGSIVGDTITIPSGEAILGCVASYAESVAVTEALTTSAEKVSNFAFNCNFQTQSLQDYLPEGMEEVTENIPIIDENSGWIFNSETGNEYKLSFLGTWQQAENEAESYGGHLVTINNSTENNWLVDNFAGTDVDSNFLWIGFSDSQSEGNWRWANGETSIYTNWHFREPNNNQGGENCAGFFTDTASFNAGLWNDVDCDNLSLGIIER